MNRVNVTNKYTPKQRKARKNLRKVISEAKWQRKQLADWWSENWHMPTKSIEANSIEITIATARLAMAKMEQGTPDGDNWYDMCERRLNDAFQQYQKAIRWALVEVALTPIVLPLRHNIGNFKRYTLKTNTYYEVFPK